MKVVGIQDQAMDERTDGVLTETERLPLEVEGLELLSDEGLNELRQWVRQEMLRRQARTEAK